MAPNEKLNDDIRDLQAVRAVLAGRKSAFRELVHRYTNQIYSLAYRLTGSEEEAEESVQEVFARAYKRLDTFDPERRFFTWLYTIALNYLRSRGRSKKWQHRKEELSFDEEIERVIPSSGNYGPEREAMRSEASRLIYRALGELKEEYRRVFVLRHMEGLEVKDVAQTLDIPENTVKTKDRRAKAQMREALLRLGWEEEE
ncbi:MAG: RNA polymerase sigma factor [Alkalispirochaetaceae bacterium]